MNSRAIFIIIDNGREREILLPTKNLQVLSFNGGKNAVLRIGRRDYISATSFIDTCEILSE